MGDPLLSRYILNMLTKSSFLTIIKLAKQRLKEI
jgi:hypothetical protein